MRLYIILRRSDSSHLGSLLMLVDLWPLAAAFVPPAMIRSHGTDVGLLSGSTQGPNWKWLNCSGVGAAVQRGITAEAFDVALHVHSDIVFFPWHFFHHDIDNKETIKLLPSSNEPLLSRSGRTKECTQRGGENKTNWMEKWAPDTWKIYWSTSKPLRPTKTLTCE